MTLAKWNLAYGYWLVKLTYIQTHPAIAKHLQHLSPCRLVQSKLRPVILRHTLKLCLSGCLDSIPSDRLVSNHTWYKAKDNVQVQSMQTCLSGLWEHMLCGSATNKLLLGESVEKDAFHTMHRLLTHRRNAWVRAPVKARAGVAQDPQEVHLRDISSPAHNNLCSNSRVARAPVMDMIWR